AAYGHMLDKVYLDADLPLQAQVLKQRLNTGTYGVTVGVQRKPSVVAPYRPYAYTRFRYSIHVHFIAGIVDSKPQNIKSTNHISHRRRGKYPYFVHYFSEINLFIFFCKCVHYRMLSSNVY